MTLGKSPIITLFKEQLENESSSLAASNNLEERGDYLIWWYFSKLVGLKANEIEEIVCDGGADLGIDAIWIDDDSMVHFYTFKNPEKINSAFPAGEVDKTLMGLNTILTRTHHSIANEELRGRVEEIYQTVPSGYRPRRRPEIGWTPQFEAKRSFLSAVRFFQAHNPLAQPLKSSLSRD